MGKSNSTTVEEVAVRGISIAHPGPPAGDPSHPVPGRSGENAGCFWRMPACPSLPAPTQMHGDKENNCKPGKPHKGRLAPLLHKVPISQKVPCPRRSPCLRSTCWCFYPCHPASSDKTHLSNGDALHYGLLGTKGGKEPPLAPGGAPGAQRQEDAKSKPQGRTNTTMQGTGYKINCLEVNRAISIEQSLSGKTTKESHSPKKGAQFVVLGGGEGAGWHGDQGQGEIWLAPLLPNITQPHPPAHLPNRPSAIISKHGSESSTTPVATEEGNMESGFLGQEGFPPGEASHPPAS